MEDLKAIIAENITQLRRANGMTQAGLAEKLNYTDKAVSKWERRESLPDITVLKAIADCFGVTVDYLITAEHKDTKQETVNEADEKMKLHTKNRGFITGMSILLVWLIACTAFIVINALDGKSCVHWLTFIYAIPISLIVWLVMNIISFLTWGILISVYLTLLMAGANAPMLFLLGVPGQAIIYLWSKIRTSDKN